MATANDRLPTSRTALTTGSRCSSFREHRATSAPARANSIAIDLLPSYRTPGALGQPRRHRLAAARGRRGAARHLRGAAPHPGNTAGRSAPGSGPATLAVSRAPGARPRRWLLVQGNLRDPRDSAGNGDVAPLSGAATSANRASRTDPRHTEHLMTCAEVPSVLDAYLDGELSVAATLQAHEHFSACENCRRILESE